MATSSRFILNGKETTPPKEAIPKPEEEGIVIEASFGTENIQPKITPLDFTFVNEGAQELRALIASGGIFEGADFQQDIIGPAGTTNVLDGYLDLADKLEIISPVQVKTQAKFKESILSLEENIGSVTLDLMDLLGVFTDADYADVQYVVEKPRNAAEIAVMSITLFLMIKELAEAIEKIAQDVATVLGLTSTAVTGSVGAIVYQVAIILVRTAYAALMLKTIIDLMTDLLEQFISPVRIDKGITYRVALEKTFAYLGYGFESPIEALDFLTYLPSSRNGEPLTKGIPNANDFGYNFGDFVTIIAKDYDIKLAVLDNVVQFRSANDPFWIKESTFVMTDVLLEDATPKGYNTEENVKSRILRYRTDDIDDWTLDNYKGTEYAITTEHTVPQDIKVSGLKGYETIDFGIALGNRKDGLNDLEELLKIVATAADVILSVFGSNKNFAGKIEKRVGMLKQSHENRSVPKLLYLINGLMPENHRDLTSAKHQWDVAINYKSFVENNFQRQRIMYEGVEVGFGQSNYLETIRNSYFKTSSGKIGKFVNLRWASEKDRAIIDFWIEEIYTTKLKELKIEQG